MYLFPTVRADAPARPSQPTAVASTASRLGLSLFWRTFILLALLLVGCIIAWLQTFRALEYAPRAIQTAQQIATLVNLSRAALVHSDAIARISLIKTLADQEQVRIQVREPADRASPLSTGVTEQLIAEELQQHLGPDTQLAASVNDEPGLWVSFRIDGDAYWLRLDRARFIQVGGRTWLIWLVTAAVLSLAGAALIARLINHPLKLLSFAASRVRDGDFDGSRLDEQAVTSEIREVNIGFNRMAQQLSKIEQDRAVMLAGISHDLRTPLARLRLETEMSVADLDARAHMAADIDQLDAIIDKFLDYARPDPTQLRPIQLADVVRHCVYAVRDQTDLRITVNVAEDIQVMADEVDLQRVIANLLENARRYGKTPGTDVARVDMIARVRDDAVMLKVRDHGPGVAPSTLRNLMQPFFRGDTARTAATGAGLGLAIVNKTVQRMGGIFSLTNTTTGGLTAHIKLQHARGEPDADNQRAVK